MRFIKFLLIVILGLSFSSKAQNRKTENSLLWEISGNGLQKSSYLFGTYHYVGKEFIDTMSVLNEKLNLVDAVVGELIMDSTLTRRLVPSMIMMDNTLDKLFNPNEFKYVAEYLKKVSGEDLRTFNIMKPVTVQMTISRYTTPKTSITASNPAMDQYLQDYGKANNKKIIGLETVEEQAVFIFGNSIARQKELLLNSIGNEKKNAKEIQKIYNDYIHQNLASLEKNLLKLQDFTQEEFDALFKNRNIKWLAQLPMLLQNQSLFIAVGAGHLVGRDGLINGLKEQGYIVLPLATN